jgi:hypothetical protein
VPRRLTRSGASAVLEEQGAPGLAALAVRTDEVVFSGRDVGGAESEQLWSEAEALAAAARSAASGARRLLARYRLRAARDLMRRLTRSQDGDR